MPVLPPSQESTEPDDTTRCHGRYLRARCEGLILCAHTGSWSLVSTVLWSAGQRHLHWSRGCAQPHTPPSKHLCRPAFVLALTSFLPEPTHSQVTSVLSVLQWTLWAGQAGNKILQFLSMLFSDICPMNTFPTLVLTVFVESLNNVFTSGKFPAGINTCFQRGRSSHSPVTPSTGQSPPRLRPPCVPPCHLGLWAGRAHPFLPVTLSLNINLWTSWWWGNPQFYNSSQSNKVTVKTFFFFFFFFSLWGLLRSFLSGQ